MQRLREAMYLQREHGWEGPLSYGTLLSLAKYERSSVRGLRWLARAEEIQIRNGDHVAHSAALLIRARLCGDVAQAATCRTQVLQYRNRLPALAACPLLAQILDQWDAWTTGAGRQRNRCVLGVVGSFLRHDDPRIESDLIVDDQ